MEALIHFPMINSEPLLDVLSTMFESNTYFQFWIMRILATAAPDAPQTHTVMKVALTSGDFTLIGVALGQIAKTGMGGAYDLGTVRDWILREHPEQARFMLARIEKIESVKHSGVKLWGQSSLLTHPIFPWRFPAATGRRRRPRQPSSHWITGTEDATPHSSHFPLNESGDGG